eukprot:Skav215459  [mRNA]  locus=C9107159:880:1260:- [translate_table: standard]
MSLWAITISWALRELQATRRFVQHTAKEYCRRIPTLGLRDLLVGTLDVELGGLKQSANLFSKDKGGDPEEFKKLVAAFEVLSDLQKRGSNCTRSIQIVFNHGEDLRAAQHVDHGYILSIDKGQHRR